MSEFLSSPPGIYRLAVTGIAALMILGAGVAFRIQSGANNNTIVQQWETRNVAHTASGRVVATMTSSGTLTLSGSIKMRGTMSGNILHIEKSITSSGTILSNGNLSGASLNISGGQSLLKMTSATATLDFGNLASLGCEVLTIAVSGATAGDTVALGVPDASNVTNGQFTAWVSANNTVTVKFCTVISGDPASGSFRATVLKF